MKDQLVSFEVAKLAKEKGFDWPTNQMYSGIMRIPQPEPYNDTRWALYHDYCLAPTQTTLQTWLRKVYLLDVLILPQLQSSCDPLPLYFIAIQDYRNSWTEPYNSSNENTLLHFDIYEEALELGLLEALKLI